MAEKQSDKGLSFEKALARLEAIVAEMEGGELSLEKMMAYFEEGTGLVKHCSQKLNEVEKKIEILVKKGDGVSAEPFDELHGESDKERG
jgi:exodeoxyribonuclease VII small subunit